MSDTTTEFNPTHLRTVHNGWATPRPVEVLSVDGPLAMIRQPVNTYFEPPRYEKTVIRTADLTPLVV